jgi:thiol-disulfide isomerase/thioredoxin
MARSPLPRRSASIALALALAGGSACPVESTPGDAALRSGAPKQASARADDHPRFAPAGPGEVDAVVREALVAATAEGRRVVVYVGATWCEPCQDFHHAVDRGELDQPLAGIRFVEFDSDHDGARLEAAGYGGRLIPRFVLPDAQGRGSEHRIEGGIKGSGAVAHIMERLGPLLASGSAPP